MKKLALVILVALLLACMFVLFFASAAKAGGYYHHGHHYVAGSHFWAGFLVGTVTFLLVEQLVSSQRQQPKICGRWTYVPASDAYGNSLGYYVQTWTQLPCD
ncbi:MAG: hypothetical protein PHW33_02950 [Candidatus Portnoybacteria bacterium]|nr:hypothetical protein [Candidatus Portnoybacteria bacterium]